MSHAVLAPRTSGVSRAVAAVATAVIALIGCALFPALSQGVAADQELVVLQAGHVAYANPDATSKEIQSISGRRPLSKVRTSLPVLRREIAPDGSPWLQVRLQGRPSQPLGWIRASKTRSKSTPWHLQLKLSNRKLTVYQYGRAVKRFTAIVGKASTPTPSGQFFIEETLRLSSSATGGPYALATSARSAVFQEFEGGPGQIAIHGMGNLSGRMGTAISHGCIRLNFASITWLAKHVGSGTPLTVRR